VTTQALLRERRRDLFFRGAAMDSDDGKGRASNE
jgi:hypothetical protein